MTLPLPASDRLLTVYLTLNQYPTLSGRMRARMRRELFERGVIAPQAFESEVREKAVQSQEREGIQHPYDEEPSDIWDLRQNSVRDQLTDFYFSQRVPYEVLEEIVREVLSESGVSAQDLLLSINPELAPQDLLFEQAMAIEKMAPEDRSRYEARLSESKVVLIRTLISDQLRYIVIAKEWFTISDLAEMRRHKIGHGRIGGKAAGMLLAARILHELAEEKLRDSLVVPESFFIGSDLMYSFMAINNLVHWNDQKYKPEAQMRAEHPQIVKDFIKGDFPPDILEKLQLLLATVGRSPIIVRSSSLLEDNFGTSFAGKYDSFFCPNQGTPDENLKALTEAIAHIYASTLNPNALLYRRSKGLQDYDERMAVLIQVVQGSRFGRYFLPDAAGVAFSRNLYRWSPQIRREDGFLRLVWGLGTRAVDRVGNDYPRLVALSHPTLRPSSAPKMIRRYSQQYVDLIDLEDNQFKTLSVNDVLNADYIPLRYLVQVDQDGYLSSLRSAVDARDNHNLLVTFDDMLRRTPFAERMRNMLHLLEAQYHAPIDMEFTAQVVDPEALHPEVRIAILQCRPQSTLKDDVESQIPPALLPEQIVFFSRYMVPQGTVEGIQYVLFVPPEAYFALPTASARSELGRAIGQVNAAMHGKTFICVGPGRWGTSNPDLGVFINYGDIYNAHALVELAGQGTGLEPEPSLGTHFFQDLIESQIYPLAIILGGEETVFNRDFFYATPNHLLEFLPSGEAFTAALRLICVEDFKRGSQLNLVMDADENQAIAYLATHHAPAKPTGEVGERIQQYVPHRLKE